MSLYRGLLREVLLREAVLHHRSLEEFNELLSGQGLCVCDNSGRGLSLHIFFFVLRFFLRRGLSLSLSLSLSLLLLRLAAGGAESRVVRDLLAAGRAESLAAVLRDLGLYLLYDVLLLVDLKDLRRDESRVSLLVSELSESGKQPLELRLLASESDSELCGLSDLAGLLDGLGRDGFCAFRDII